MLDKVLVKALQDIDLKKHRRNPFDEKYLGLCLSEFDEVRQLGRVFISISKDVFLPNLHASACRTQAAAHKGKQILAEQLWRAPRVISMQGLRSESLPSPTCFAHALDALLTNLYVRVLQLIRSMKLVLLMQSADAVKLCQTEKPAKRVIKGATEASAKPQDAVPGPSYSALHSGLPPLASV